ncbi:hypothetical protein [Micromonospora sp. ATA51]|uniref:hypothetical protein n=1 Tax=Micromonospora sp. ATA51 TaxID=2806098 RepID=UPI001A3FAA89|nr:hypothetical protein [Micromonospora sp. ATA51]MBM0224743.1 hypothetical protein [Micromonospora sp. ATA51]
MYGTTEQHDPMAHLYRGLDVEDADSAVSVILKLRGETRDIDCLYCYEKRKEVPGEPGSTPVKCVGSPSSSRGVRSPSNCMAASR